MQIPDTDFKALQTATEQFHQKHTDAMAEVKARLLDVEQGRAHRPAFGDEVGAGAIVKAIADSPQLKLLQSGAVKEARFPLPPGALQTKTAILGPVTAGAAALQAPDRTSEIFGPARRRLTVRNLLPSLPTTAGATQYTRLLSYTNNAQIQGIGSSPFETEGATKGESAMGFELITAPIVTIAHLIPASNQVLDDMPALQRFVDAWLIYGLSLVEEGQLLNGSGLAGNLPGILSLATQFTGGSTNQTRLDTIRKAITQLQLAYHVPTGVVLHPIDWEAIELYKNTLGDYLDITLTDANGNPVAWRVPVVVTVAIAAGTFLVGDFQSAVIRDRQLATIEISNSHLDYFARNLIAIRAELREGLEIHQPAGFVTGSLNFEG